MILSNKTILDRLSLDVEDNKKLSIEPFVESNLQPASYDITLSNSFAIPKNNKNTVYKTNREYTYKNITDETFILYPKKFVLTSTMEYVMMPIDIAAQVEGRSSVGRIGLFIQNAGWIDPGFEGQITLELYNASNAPIELTAGMRIGQLIFSEVTPGSRPYSGKYQRQIGATGSRLYQDFKED